MYCILPGTMQICNRKFALRFPSSKWWRHLFVL